MVVTLLKELRAAGYDLSSLTQVGSEAFLKEDLKGAPELTVPEGIPVHFHPQCSETAIRLLDKVWTKVKQ